MRRSLRLGAWAMAAVLVLCGGDTPAALKIQVIEGEGAVYATGSRATRGITVGITDESGNPVPAATISFTLPSGGASGTFASGGRSASTMTGPDGRATVWGMRWNGTPGPVEVRISAVKGAARASMICTVQLDYARKESAGSGGHMWLWIALAVAGAAGGSAAALGHQSSPGTSAVPVNPVHIGAPSISLEKP
jgi:hypothetical protein